MHERGVELGALELVLEEGSLADQGLVLGVELDRGFRVGEEVLELVDHLARERRLRRSIGRAKG